MRRDEKTLTKEDKTQNTRRKRRTRERKITQAKKKQSQSALFSAVWRKIATRGEKNGLAKKKTK